VSDLMTIQTWEIHNRVQHSSLLAVKVSGTQVDPNMFVVWCPTGADGCVPAHFDSEVSICPGRALLSIASATDMDELGTEPDDDQPMFRTDTFCAVCSSMNDLNTLKNLLLDDIRANLRIQRLPESGIAVVDELVNDQDTPDSDAVLYFPM